MEKNYKNLGFILMLLLPLTFLGFYKSYLIQFPDFEDKFDFYFHLHALIAFIWILMFGIQPLLIRYNRYDIHRLIGKLSYFFFTILLLSLLALIWKKYERGDDLMVSVFNFILLVIFYSLAILKKKNPAIHMRYMIALALVFISPILGRVLIHWFQITFIQHVHIVFTSINLLLVSLIIIDKSNQRPYKPYLLALICYLAYQIIYYMFYL